MRKKIDPDEYLDTQGPMNPVSKQDALVFTNLHEKETLDPLEERAVRLKKKKLVTSTKKHERKLNHNVLDVIDDIEINPDDDIT